MKLRASGSFKRGGAAGAKVISLVLLAVGLMLVVVIAIHTSGIYSLSKDTGKEQGLSSVRCVGFLYDISNIRSTAGRVEFEFINKISSTEDVHNVTVLVGSSTWQTMIIYIPIGTSAIVSAPVKVLDEFIVYPDNCQIYPALCSLSGSCH